MMKNIVLAAATAIALAAGVPGSAGAQQGARADRMRNERATAGLIAKFDGTAARIEEGRRAGKITPARAEALRRQIDRTRAEMARSKRQQGFVSAAQLASYDRAWSAMEVDLDRRGVARGYGNDALVASDTPAYSCQNEPVRLDIPSMPLGQALNRFRAVTRCPVSVTVQEVANTDVNRVPTYAVQGRYTPGRGLREMLSSSPLKVREVRGGFSIYMN